MNVHFSKYHGAGNDFIMVDGREQNPALFTENVIRILCDRHFGIGADGLIILLADPESDFRMIYFNADGREGTMCGNGGRCITAFARRLGIIGDHALFSGIDGLHESWLLGDIIKLKMQDVNDFQKLEDGYLLDTGSPHFVKFVSNTDNLDVANVGRAIRHEARFGPGGVNVNFVQLLAESGSIKVRTFERGVEAETLSCGTGVTASAISSFLESGAGETTYRIETIGGMLEVSFSKEGQNGFSEIFLSGPAEHVFDGTIDTDTIS